MKPPSFEDLEVTKSFLSRLPVRDGTVVTDPSIIFALDGSGTIGTPLDCNDPSSAEVIVKTVKALRNAFCFLEDVTLQGLVHIRTEISASGKDYAGMDSLPDEIFKDILRRIRVRGRSIEPLLGTSRSIRRRLTNLPEFWTNISTEKNPVNYLEWSKPLKLAVTVCESKYNSQLTGRLNEQERNSEERKETSRAKAFLSLVGRHSSRWKSFNFRDRGDEVCLMQMLAAESFPKMFPVLESLVLVYNAHEAREIEQLHNTSDAAKDFVSHWRMPALNHLAFGNFLPSRIQGSPTKFEFKLYHSEFCGEWNLTRLTTLLNSFRLLRHLSISLRFMLDARHEGPPALLENLESLYLSLDDMSFDFLVATLASFEAPNVQDLLIDFKCDLSQEDEIPMVKSLFPDDRSRWPKAKSLSVRLPFYDDEEFGELTSLHVGLARLPELSYLTVRSTYCSGRRADEEILSRPDYRSPKLLVHPSLRENRSPFPPLVFLSLNRCPFDITFFTDHADIFNSPRFQRLEIQKCKNIDAPVLRSLLPADKALCYDRKPIPSPMT